MLLDADGHERAGSPNRAYQRPSSQAFGQNNSTTVERRLSHVEFKDINRKFGIISKDLHATRFNFPTQNGGIAASFRIKHLSFESHLANPPRPPPFCFWQEMLQKKKKKTTPKLPLSINFSPCSLL